MEGRRPSTRAYALDGARQLAVRFHHLPDYKGLIDVNYSCIREGCPERDRDRGSAELSKSSPRIIRLVMLAYIDPGAGSFIIQALLATIAGAVVAVNAYWKRIRRFLGLTSHEKKEPPEPDTPADD